MEYQTKFFGYVINMYTNEIILNNQTPKVYFNNMIVYCTSCIKSYCSVFGRSTCMMRVCDALGVNFLDSVVHYFVDAETGIWNLITKS